MDIIQDNVTGRKDVPGIYHNNGPTFDPEELIDATEAARLLRQKTQTLATWRSENRGPAFFKIGRAVFYTRGGISDWVKTCIVRPPLRPIKGA